MNHETLETILQEPRLQAALLSKYWSPQDAEIILAALSRSGLSPRRFAERAGIGYRRLYDRLKRLKTEPPGASAATGTEPLLPPQFVPLAVNQTPAMEPEKTRPLGLKIRFYRPVPDNPEQLVMELEVPLW